MGFLDRLNWRYATKGFDTARALPEEKLQKILEATRLAPTSFGLQPFHVHIVRSPEMRALLGEAGWKQPQWTTAPVTLVFTTRTDVNERISAYFDLASSGDPKLREAMAGYEKMMRGWSEKLDAAHAHEWSARQAYIAFSFAMAACAELEVDACPMEGFAPAKFDQILRLPPNRKSVVALTIGYRDPNARIRPKVRFDHQDLFTEGFYK